MPLATRVSFETVLEKGNRLQIPKLIRWQFKMEQNQILNVRVSPKRLLGFNKCFYAKVDKQGRILIPKLMLALMANKENPNLEGYIFDVWLEPA
jgi:bifunctional DNA-binding transcriptional regulator/antitoxin component of YhaV-PrlF toxin-antitoxin module